MKKYLKEFLHRGLIFGGFGPIVAGIILYCVGLSVDIKFSGNEVLIAIVSTYFLAFVQAGASIFNQIESWNIPKSIGFHLGSIYIAYLSCYLINYWIPFNWLIIILFTLLFVATYFIIWIVVYLIVRKTTKEMNKKIA